MSTFDFNMLHLGDNWGKNTNQNDINIKTDEKMDDSNSFVCLSPTFEFSP